jgi:hypothetical protein
MALSMDEQRVLAEIERRLAADDPGLATCLTSFRRPGPATVLRSPRARIIGSLFTVLLVAMVSLMVYAMIPFRAHGARTPTTPGTGAITVSASGARIGAASAPPASAKANAKANANANASARTSAQPSSARKSGTPAASATATGNAKRAKGQAAGQAVPAATGP